MSNPSVVSSSDDNDFLSSLVVSELGENALSLLLEESVDASLEVVIDFASSKD